MSRISRNGWLLVARLVVIVAIPSALLIRFGVADIGNDKDIVAAADGLVALVDLDRAVAALAAPAYIENLALVGLAAIDNNGIDRSFVFGILDRDYEAIYEGNKPSLDAALPGVAAADRDLVLDGTRTLGDEIDRVLGLGARAQQAVTPNRH